MKRKEALDEAETKLRELRAQIKAARDEASTEKSKIQSEKKLVESEFEQLSKAKACDTWIPNGLCCKS